MQVVFESLVLDFCSANSILALPTVGLMSQLNPNVSLLFFPFILLKLIQVGLLLLAVTTLLLHRDSTQREVGMCHHISRVWSSCHVEYKHTSFYRMDVQ